MIPWVGSFLARGALFDKNLVEVHMMSYTIISMLLKGLVVSDNKFYSRFPYISHVKHVTPGVEP